METGVKCELLFSELRANIMIVYKKMVETADCKAFPIVTELKTTREKLKKWVYISYWIPLLDHAGKHHQILGYEMETMMLDPLEIKGVQGLFKLKPSVDIDRLAGEGDILVGIYEAKLHPVAMAYVGNLKLLSIKFGSRILLGGLHAILDGSSTLSHTKLQLSSKWFVFIF